MQTKSLSPFTDSNRKDNWAFIDLQNVIKGTKEKGLKIDWKTFREFLRNNYAVERAILFIGFIKNKWRFYDHLSDAGYEFEFREIKFLPGGKIDGGNVDTDLVASVMDNKNNYQKAVLVADDGDYYSTLRRLTEQNKLLLVVSPHTINRTSEYIKRVTRRNQLISMYGLDNVLAPTS